MATTRRRFIDPDDVQCCNRRVSRFLPVSLRLYKLIKIFTQLAAVGAGIYAMWLGADPGFMFVLIATVVTDPEMIEYVVSEGYADDRRDGS